MNESSVEEYLMRQRDFHIRQVRWIERALEVKRPADIGLPGEIREDSARQSPLFKEDLT